MNTIGSTGAAAVGGQHAGRPDRARMDETMAPVADLLNMEPDELRAAAASGQTLAELAEAQGVNREDLVAAMTEGLEKLGVPGDPQEIAEHIVDNTPPRPPAGATWEKPELSTLIDHLQSSDDRDELIDLFRKLLDRGAIVDTSL